MRNTSTIAMSTIPMLTAITRPRKSRASRAMSLMVSIGFMDVSSAQVT